MHKSNNATKLGDDLFEVRAVGDAENLAKFEVAFSLFLQAAERELGLAVVWANVT